MVLGLSELSQILALSLNVKGKAFILNKSISNAASLNIVQIPQNPEYACMDFRFPYHERSGAGASNRVSLPHPL